MYKHLLMRKNEKIRKTINRRKRNEKENTKGNESRK